jgi:hypothetical protein
MSLTALTTFLALFFYSFISNESEVQDYKLIKLEQPTIIENTTIEQDTIPVLPPTDTTAIDTLKLILKDSIPVKDTLVIKLDPSWKKGGKFSMTLSQVSLSNWAAGGENSFGGNSYLNLFANYKRGSRAWDNNLSMAFGILKLMDQDPRKSEDKIDFMSKYGHEISKQLYLSTNLNLLTQFAKGYKYPNDSVVVSTFFAPAYVQLGVGLDYKPASFFSVSFLPITGRLTIVKDQALANLGAYGVEKATFDVEGNIIKEGRNARYEVGCAVISTIQKEILKNVEFKSKLQLFSNYIENPQNIDINWDSMLSLRVNKYISTNIGLLVLYDDDVNIVTPDGKSGPRTQLKQTFGFGLSMDY